MLLTLKKNRTTKPLFEGRKGFGIGFGAPPDGATPETILEIYGEYWDGANMNPPYVGTAVTEVNSLSSLGPLPPLNKKIINNITNGAYLSLANTLNANDDNYVCFWVAQNGGTLTTHLLADFRADSGTDYNLILETSNGAGNPNNGYLYGNPGLQGSFPVIAGEDTTLYKIRVLILQAGAGNLYLNGGASVHNDSWEPSNLGGAGYRSRLIANTAFSKIQNVAHLSIHKFGAADLVSLAWVNAYGNALNAYYDSLSWTNIV